MQTSATTWGVVYVHSALPAICPHIEWAISGVLGTKVALAWTPQSAAPGHQPIALLPPSCLSKTIRRH